MLFEIRFLGGNEFFVLGSRCSVTVFAFKPGWEVNYVRGRVRFQNKN
jgi:hypothetical protein